MTTDRVSADLSRYMLAQERALLEDAASSDYRKWEAMEALTDPRKLEAVMNDTDLAQPLAECFRNLERARHDDKAAQDAIYAALHRMEKTCFHWLLGEE